MSKTIVCPGCGQLTDVPAYPGDGAYRTCYCAVGRFLARQSPPEPPEPPEVEPDA